MRTRRLFLNRLDPATRARDAVVVIDVLRSFSTAAYAFAAGASTIYPVETISAAFRLQRAARRSDHRRGRRWRPDTRLRFRQFASALQGASWPVDR
jgi:hypothetical protein